jgi:hypothetical protein
MSTLDFWDNVLERDEKLLWTGRPKPLLHWRNWRLFGPAPMAAAGLFLAGGIILYTSGKDGDVWLLVLPALLVLIPARATWRQLQTYKATRYALTDKRALFFHIGAETRVRAVPRNAMIPPVVQNTVPSGVSFLGQGPKNTPGIGFEFVSDAGALVRHLDTAP